jgi:Gpi18-like mannosyltransferase
LNIKINATFCCCKMHENLITNFAHFSQYWYWLIKDNFRANSKKHKNATLSEQFQHRIGERDKIDSTSTLSWLGTCTSIKCGGGWISFVIPKSMFEFNLQ